MGRFHRLLKKVMCFKINSIDDHRRLPAGEDRLKLVECSSSSTTPRGYVPIYVGDNQQRYLVPMSAVNSTAFEVMLDRYKEEDDAYIGAQSGPLSVSCSAVDFETVLRRVVVKA